MSQSNGMECQDQREESEGRGFRDYGNLASNHYLELKKKNKQEAEEYRLTGWQEISFRPHDLRHTFVTVGRDRGVDLKVMISWCGHASEKMVLEIYDHPSKDREQSMIDLMDT